MSLYRVTLGFWLFGARYRLAMASGGAFHDGARFKDHLSVHLILVFLLWTLMEFRQVPSGAASAKSLDTIG